VRHAEDAAKQLVGNLGFLFVPHGAIHKATPNTTTLSFCSNFELAAAH